MKKNPIAKTTLSSLAAMAAVNFAVLGCPSHVEAEPAGTKVAAKQKPLMKDFIGLNTHTIQFKPDLYKPTSTIIRDYHPMAWDLGDNDPGGSLSFPVSKNNIDWQKLYKGWQDQGHRILTSLMFEHYKPEQWKNMEKDAGNYGEQFAKYFGPSGPNKLVEAAEVGNEPEKYDEKTYRIMFESMAKGIRKGDPKMLISTCAVKMGKEDKYSKDIACLKGLEHLYDILNIHSYAFKTFWPTWERTYPEDAKVDYLSSIQQMIDWRNKNAQGKQIWLTEFGWDASTQPAPATGDFAKFMGNTDPEQARYIVRSYLLFSDMDIDRAYLYWFNDSDKNTLHASSGLTRDYKPKPSYWAVAHLQKALGDYRFDKVVQKSEQDGYVFQYRNGKDSKDIVWAAWMPQKGAEAKKVRLPKAPGKIVKAEAMPLKEGAAAPASATANGNATETTLTGDPVYIWIRG